MLFSLAGTPAAHAAAAPDRLGICYLFDGDSLRSRLPCVIASEDDKNGSLSVTLDGLANWPVAIVTVQRPGAPTEVTMDGHAAEGYWRDSQLRPVPPEDIERVVRESGAEALFPCYRQPRSNISYCYRLNP